MDTRTKWSFETCLDMATCGESKKPSLMWIVDICDLIEAGDVEPKTVLDSIKTKLKWESDCTILLTLQVLESIVKNCGDFINDELTTKTFCDMLHNLARTTRHDGVKQKLLELIQTWDYVFGGKPQHINLRVLLNTMKAEGFVFPQLQVSDALFVVYGAPRSNQMAQKSEPARNKNKDFLNNLTQKATDEGQLSSNAATSRSGQYNQRPIMMQTNGDSITSRFRDVEPFKSGLPAQNLCHLNQHIPQSSAQNATTGKNVTKMTSSFPSQTPPQTYPFHNSLSKCRITLFRRQTVLPSYVSPTTTTQSLPQINIITLFRNVEADKPF
ncbi:VHS domain [Popillia japonica]|uniref:VHS domain n=1 Tax=Popillia japonica TaxID=7064 RepID=A0AAW1JJ06_POPJA